MCVCGVVNISLGVPDLVSVGILVWQGAGLYMREAIPSVKGPQSLRRKAGLVWLRAV